MRVSTAFIVFGVLMSLLVSDLTSERLRHVQESISQKNVVSVNDLAVSLSTYPGDKSFFDIGFSGVDAAADNFARGQGKFRCPVGPTDTEGMLQFLAEFFQKRPKAISDSSTEFVEQFASELGITEMQTLNIYEKMRAICDDPSASRGPSLLSIKPELVETGTAVVIRGFGFDYTSNQIARGNHVLFDGNDVGIGPATNRESIYFTVPASCGSGTYDVSVMSIWGVTTNTLPITIQAGDPLRPRSEASTKKGCEARRPLVPTTEPELPINFE